MEKQGLLDCEASGQDQKAHAESRNQSRGFNLQNPHLQWLLIAQLLFIIIQSGLLLVWSQVGCSPNLKSTVYTPAQSAVVFEPKRIDGKLYDPSVFKGKPNPAMVEAWDAMFKNAYVRVSSQELSRMNRTSTPLQDNSGDYLGALDMYHQLHCVVSPASVLTSPVHSLINRPTLHQRYIHEYVHPEYYKMPKINVDPQDHLDHCIDIVRQVVICHADPTVSTFSFRPNYDRAWPEFDAIHECRSWDRLSDWAGGHGRAVDSSKMDVLARNPDYIGGDFDGHE